MKFVSYVALAILLLAKAELSTAASCTPFLTKTTGQPTVNIVTMNRLGTATYSTLSATLVKGIKTPTGATLPTRIVGQISPQFFNDRKAPASGQPFDMNQTDKVSISMTVADSPSVSFTLVTDHSQVVSFTGTCSSTGIMHGSTPDVDYLILVTYSAPIL
jgi:hypothetical protein